MKRLTLIACFLVAAVSAHAQLKVNPKVGLNFSSIATHTSDIVKADGVRAGFNAGVDLRFGDGWFFWQPGFHYYSVGAELVTSNTTNSTEIRDIVAVRSIKIPLDGGFYLTGTDGIMKVRLNAGITPTVTFGVEKNDLGITKSDFNTFGFGFNAGVGVDLAIVTVDLGYEGGITDVFKHVAGSDHILTLSAGLVF